MMCGRACIEPISCTAIPITHTVQSPSQNPYLCPWAWVKGLQKPTGTPTHMGLCLQRWPMNLARAVQVSMDTAMHPCKDQKVIWSVLWDFRWFHGCFHGWLVIIWGLCLWGAVDVGVVIMFAVAWGGLVLVMFVARFAWSGQCSQHGGRWKGH